MDIFVYSDESGVFDKVHNRYYVFGGLLFLSKDSKDICSRKYIKAEKDVRAALHMPDGEVKASSVTNKYKGKLYRSLNQEIKFGVVIDEHALNPQIFSEKKHKQRYLDYAYKIMIRRCLENLIQLGLLSKDESHHFHFFVDEHTTATDGKYELRESLEQEFFYGTFNIKWDKFFQPVFSQKGSIDLEFCNSEKRTLVRSADIIANRIYHQALTVPNYSSNSQQLFVIRLP